MSLLYEARTVMETYRVYYNERRPHSVLHYRVHTTTIAATLSYVWRSVTPLRPLPARRDYWEQHRSAVKYQLISTPFCHFVLGKTFCHSPGIDRGSLISPS